MRFQPTRIAGVTTGLVQNRQEFILPNDAFPRLENAYLFREQIRRKQGWEKLGRLRRAFIDVGIGLSQASPWTFNLLRNSGYVVGADNANPGQITTAYAHNLTNGDTVFLSGLGGATGYNNASYTITVVDATNFTVGVDATGFGVYTTGGFFFSNIAIDGEPDASLQPGSVVITIGGTIVFTDQGDGTLTSPTPGNSGTINYITGSITLTHTAGAGAVTTASFGYFPALPVMGIRRRELDTINNEQTVFWDQKYAYVYFSDFEEFIPGTIWTGTDYEFFWTTNYFVGDGNARIFWETNNSGTSGDPIRYTNSTVWVDFAPTIDSSGNKLQQCASLVPFRGALLAFNTYEGTTLAGSLQYPQRIRWNQIGGTPFETAVPGVVTNVNPNSWRDDIRGQGGFLDIPTSQSIVSVGFVRDNLVIYCERSTWQLRFTGRSISPFQIEKVNSELGTESQFSAVQFDTSLVGIGDKGIVECDSFQSNRIDIKIPDLVFFFNNDSNGQKRVHGVRDFQRRVAYWTYVWNPNDGVTTPHFPNRRLVYNYENDSWGIFTDSLTTLGTFQYQSDRAWNTSDFEWQEANFTWGNRPSQFPSIVGGNQQGYVLTLDQQTTNDPSLFIEAITGNLATNTPTVITSPDHNLQTGNVISIAGVIGADFSSLNGKKFGVVVLTNDTFQLWVYDPATRVFSKPQLDAAGTYLGGGEILVRDNFSIVSKKFNFTEQGQNIQLGYLDALMNATDQGAITLNVFYNYNDSLPINQLPENINDVTQQPDEFFNQTVPTIQQGAMSASKFWQRVYCNTRGAFLTLEWTLSNSQLIGNEQESDVQIDAMVLWMRPAGNQLIAGG